MPEIIDPIIAPTPPAPRVTELEITTGRRAFATAQALLAGGPVGAALRLQVGWYGAQTNPEDGSFAVIDPTSGLDDLAGEIVQVTFAGRAVFAYVIDYALLPDGIPMAVSRRLFAALNRLTLPSLPAQVVIVN